MKNTGGSKQTNRAGPRYTTRAEIITHNFLFLFLILGIFIVFFSSSILLYLFILVTHLVYTRTSRASPLSQSRRQRVAPHNRPAGFQDCTSHYRRRCRRKHLPKGYNNIIIINAARCDIYVYYNKNTTRHCIHKYAYLHIIFSSDESCVRRRRRKPHVSTPKTLLLLFLYVGALHTRAPHIRTAYPNTHHNIIIPTVDAGRWLV